jgi:hypothetical protein
VDFPHPDGPSKPTNFPSGMVKLKLLTAIVLSEFLLSKILVKFSNLTSIFDASKKTQFVMGSSYQRKRIVKTIFKKNNNKNFLTH